MKFAVLTSASAANAAPVHAGEIYGGVYDHATDTPFTLDTHEGGVDVQLGYRLDPVLPIAGVEPYVFGSINSDEGGTDFIGVGVSRKFGLGPLYVRPGVGLVVHNAPSSRANLSTGLRTDLGSRILFEPEIALGVAIAPRVSVEASWVHISNARLFDSQQNPGIDMIGVRANLKL